MIKKIIENDRHEMYRCARCCNEHSVWRGFVFLFFFFFSRHVFLLILTPNYFTIDKIEKRENLSTFCTVDAWLRSVFGEMIGMGRMKRMKGKEKRGVRKKKELKVNPFHWSNAENGCKKQISHENLLKHVLSKW